MFEFLGPCLGLLRVVVAILTTLHIRHVIWYITFIIWHYFINFWTVCSTVLCLCYSFSSVCLSLFWHSQLVLIQISTNNTGLSFLFLNYECNTYIGRGLIYKYLYSTWNELLIHTFSVWTVDYIDITCKWGK